MRTLYRLGWILALAVLLLGGLSAAPALAAPKKGGVLSGAHGNRSLLPLSCRACHHGMAMAINGEEQGCLSCHGNDPDRQQMQSKGLLSKSAGRLADIGAELRKPYSHPVLRTKGVHRQGEALPEELVNAARHAECVDCHHPHVVATDAPFRGLKGKRVGNFIADIAKEYELCYRCHSISANLPLNASDKAAEFRPTNPSFHPVEAEGKNAYVISLKAPYVARQEKAGDVSVISCRDCHGSDDPNGPRGPHGSSHRGLLSLNYEMEDGYPESEHAYALCYKCHTRTSILSNESFPFHALHIQGNRATNSPGTSCYSCHDAHGSSRYQFLIRFNENLVRPNADNKLEFKAQGVATRHGSCLLNCHGVEHNPKEY